MYESGDACGLQRRESIRRCESVILCVNADTKGEHSPGARVPSMGQYLTFNIRSKILDQQDVSNPRPVSATTTSFSPFYPLNAVCIFFFLPIMSSEMFSSFCIFCEYCFFLTFIYLYEGPSINGSYILFLSVDASNASQSSGTGFDGKVLFFIGERSFFENFQFGSWRMFCELTRLKKKKEK